MTQAILTSRRKTLDYVNTESHKNPMEIRPHPYAQPRLIDIGIPAGWVTSQPMANQHSLSQIESFSPQDNDDIKLNLYYRGQPLSKASAQAFSIILASKPALKGNQLLSPAEIKSLKEVAGSSTIGDNQFTNDKNSTERKQTPIFNLTNAFTTLINGKTALLIEGRFVAEDGSPTREFIGVFLPRNKECSIVHEAYLEGKSAEKLEPTGFIVYRGIFQRCLKTIRF